MAFDLRTIAQELGIDVATLEAKPDVVAKWNGYLSEADAKYTQATAAQREASEKLAAVQEEQRIIDENIAKYGETEANLAALRANNAAMKASLEAMKEQGFNVDIPNMPTPAASSSPQFDPNAFKADVNQSLILGFDMNNRYQRLYGSAMPDDLSVLLREASAARKPLPEYVAQKYDFAGQEKKLAEERQAKRDAEIRAAAIKEYQEKNPVTQGNPEMARGIASRHAMLAKPMPNAELKDFARLSARDKIARSLARSKEIISQAS